MATTIDHLRVDHLVTVLREFTDADGVTLRVGDGGVLRELSYDQIRLEIHLEIERAEGDRITLRFLLKAPRGPGNGRMKEFFALGDYVPVPGSKPVRRDPLAREMIVPPPLATNGPLEGASSMRPAWRLDGPDRLEAEEQQLLRSIPHLGVAASIAEMYAQRMRAFQRAGNEPRAIAAFKLATQWMGTYASQATSGGEGAALSLERDEFHAALVREFGYDPTDGGT